MKATHLLVVGPCGGESFPVEDEVAVKALAARLKATIIPVVAQPDGSYRTIWDAVTDEKEGGS